VRVVHRRQLCESSFGTLESLSLAVPVITDALLSVLALKLRRLMKLYLRDVGGTAEHSGDLSNSGIAALGSSYIGGQLTHLTLIRSYQDASGCVRLHGRFSEVNDVGLMLALSNMSQLTYLKLSGFRKVGSCSCVCDASA
jgi:hypothetical protein